MLCRAGYTIERGTACLAGTVDSGGSVPSECGDENSGYIQAYCTDGTNLNNHRDCPETYTTAQGAVVDSVLFAGLGGKALNSEGTALLTGKDAFIASGNPTSGDNAANFIFGESDNLNLVLLRI